MISETSPQFLTVLLTLSLPLAAVLVYKSLKPSENTTRFYFLLFFLLYANLMAGLLFRTGSPKALTLCGLTLIPAGLMVFYGEIFRELVQKWSRPSALQELKQRKGVWHEVVMACQLISEARMGALLILQRQKNLDNWAGKGIRLDAKVSRELLVSIFTPPGALHDGAAIIQPEKILSAAVIVPLSKNPNLSKELGTRHRAAVGFSEVSDALCVVISEETGAISLADRGKLFYDVPFEKLSGVLERALRFKLDRAKSAALYTEPSKVPV